MPMQIDIDKGRGLVTTRASGNVSDADIIAMEDLFGKSPDFSRKFARICDLTKATDLKVSEALMKRWAEDPVMDRSARHAIPREQQRSPELFGHAAFYGWSEDKARQATVPEGQSFPGYLHARGFNLE